MKSTWNYDKDSAQGLAHSWEGSKNVSTLLNINMYLEVASASQKSNTKMCGLCCFLGQLHFRPVFERIHSWRSGLGIRYLKQSNLFIFKLWLAHAIQDRSFMLQLWLELARTAIFWMLQDSHLICKRAIQEHNVDSNNVSRNTVRRLSTGPRTTFLQQALTTLCLPG